MIQEYKNTLLRDLCARMPYEVKCKYYDVYENCYEEGTVLGFERKEYIVIDGKCVIAEEVRPYLFPFSSMTEEQKKEYCSLVWFDGLSAGWNRDDAVILNEVEMLIDFYHKNHLDWRGLIEKGLALDATGLNIY